MEIFAGGSDHQGRATCARPCRRAVQDAHDDNPNAAGQTRQFDPPRIPRRGGAATTNRKLEQEGRAQAEHFPGCCARSNAPAATGALLHSRSALAAIVLKLRTRCLRYSVLPRNSAAAARLLRTRATPQRAVRVARARYRGCYAL